MFHSFFSSLARSRYLSFFSFSFNFTLSSSNSAIFFIVDYFRVKSSSRDYYYHYYYYYFTSCESLALASADDLSLGTEWLLVSSSLLDSSQYSGWSQQSECFRLVLRFSTLPAPLGTIPSPPIISNITVTIMFHCFLVLWQGPTICLFFTWHILKSKIGDRNRGLPERSLFNSYYTEV